MNKIKPLTSDKEKIREEVRQRISLLSEKEKNEAIKSLCKKLLSSPVIQSAQNIIIYKALDDEVNLALLVEELQKQKKNIFIIDLSGNYFSLPSEGVLLVP